MIFVPLPFVVALLLALMLVSIFRRNGEARSNYAFLALIGLTAIQSVLVGLRWGYDITWLKIVLPVIASLLPPLVYSSFRTLIDLRPRAPKLVWISYALPPALIVLARLVLPVSIDSLLIALFVGYAVAILLLGRRGPDGLEDAQFSSAAKAHAAIYIAASALCLSAIFDVLVLVDFQWASGDKAAIIVSNGNLLGLLLIGLTAWMAGESKSEGAVLEADTEVVAVAASAEDQDIMLKLEDLMARQKVYRDENLSLSRLSRKLGLPSRAISVAINRATGGNVSQYVNQLRIREACQLLEETDQSVTAIMLESGFQTKSNFNREFRRITGMSPLAWRERQVWKLAAPSKNGHPQLADGR